MSKLSDWAKGIDWKDIVKSVAPTVGVALGGPFGGLAGSVLSKVLTGKEDASEEEIIEAIKMDPNAALKLKEAEFVFLQKMEENKIRREELVYKDIASARDREKVVRDKTPAILSYLSIGSFAVFVGGTLIFPDVFQTAPRDFIYLVVGYLSGYVSQAFTYYLGSSKGSKDKTEALAQAIAKSREKE